MNFLCYNYISLKLRQNIDTNHRVATGGTVNTALAGITSKY